MAKKWEQMTKNEKLDALRADVTKIADAVSKLTRRSEPAAQPAPKKAAKKAAKKAPKKVAARAPRASARPMKPKGDPRSPAPAEAEEAKAN